ncbi:uncharacterized protein LOC129618543 [Condylostylus longicornis]|uniref:uncharacterized protein LOC129618543 n=1 Tax=Condylostylus longicornis TaxID=2530218 RepID=UPI00244DDF9E|nr:uncharacterized protein LOC129618543 [Condylostylus longicornis]
MEKIISEVKNAGRGYRTSKGEIKIICYADDAVLISENEDELQKLLHQFYITSSKLNMEISVAKTKSLVIAKEPLRCKLAVNDKIIEQVMSFKYLGVEVSACQNRNKENMQQLNKAARVSGCLSDIIWKNKHMGQVAKIKIYKSCVRPIMTYAAETKAETSKTKANSRAAEMKTLRQVAGRTLQDRVPSAEIRNTLDVQDVVRWVRARRRAWNEHVSRMQSDRIAKIARDGKPSNTRPPGRPPKRWIECWTSTSQEAN